MFSLTLRSAAFTQECVVGTPLNLLINFDPAQEVAL